jgi:hypothetical protein
MVHSDRFIHSIRGDNAPVVEAEAAAEAPPLAAVPANANADTDEAPRFVLRFAGA